MAPLRPGGFVRRSGLPDGLSVTRAARAFGVRMDTLLRMQARFDAFRMRQRAAAIEVPPFAGG